MRSGKVGITALCLALLCLGMAGVAPAAGLQTHTNSIGMEFVLIPAGSFMMGTDPKVEQGRNDERPRHKVTISKPFYMGKYEVTQAQWEAVMGNNPSTFKGGDNPVEMVSWDDAQEFIRRLNAGEGHTRYRLPTEAEWEYAARAGTDSTWFFGDDEDELSTYAWWTGNSGKATPSLEQKLTDLWSLHEDLSGKTTHPVGQKPANPWGLHDVHGNVWEWVQDRHGAKYYASSPEYDPEGPVSDYHFARGMRGGCWATSAVYSRSGNRSYDSPDSRTHSAGFRLALSL